MFVQQSGDSKNEIKKKILLIFCFLCALTGDVTRLLTMCNSKL